MGNQKSSKMAKILRLLSTFIVGCIVVCNAFPQNEIDDDVAARYGIQRGNQQSQNHVEPDQNKNVKIHGEMNAALNTEKNATIIPDPSKYRMRKMNVQVERSGVARSIGKSLSKERRFGLIT